MVSLETGHGTEPKRGWGLAGGRQISCIKCDSIALPAWRSAKICQTCWNRDYLGACWQRQKVEREAFRLENEAANRAAEAEGAAINSEHYESSHGARQESQRIENWTAAER